MLLGEPEQGTYNVLQFLHLKATCMIWLSNGKLTSRLYVHSLYTGARTYRSMAATRGL